MDFIRPWNFFLGCNVKFKNFYTGNQIKLLDLGKKDQDTLYWKYVNGLPSDKVKSSSILSIASYHDSEVAKNSFLKLDGKPEKKGGNYEIKIKVMNWLKWFDQNATYGLDLWPGYTVRVSVI